MGPAMSTDESSDFGRLLRPHRIAAGLSQEALAERAGLSTRGISDLERGLRTTPQRQTVRRLADALGLSAADRSALEEAVDRQRGPAAAPPPSPSTNLPRPATDLIGREAEVADLEALLGDRAVRLVTLLGPGGVGKTHLALHVAARLQARFAGGAWFV